MADSCDWDRVALLVRQARRGDQKAFSLLLQMHRGAVVSTLYACGVRSSETAGDLAQDVAMRSWLRLASLKDPRAFPAWLRRIAANAARDHLRRLATRREDELDLALSLESDDDPHDRAERSAEVRLMLAALADEDAEVVQLLVARANGVPVETLAAELEISPEALKMRVMRARKRLRARLEALRTETG